MFPNDCIIELWYKPFMWRRADVRLWRVLISYFKYKPFMWCRPDVRLGHALSLFSVISPLCGVAPTPDCGISFKALSVLSPRRPTVAFLLKPFLWCRPDIRLWYFFLSPLCGVAKTPDCGIISLYLFVHLSRRRFRHPIGLYLCSVGFQADYRRFPFYLPVMPILFIVH